MTGAGRTVLSYNEVGLINLNDVDPSGASIDTSGLYGRNLSGETWFQ